MRILVRDPLRNPHKHIFQINLLFLEHLQAKTIADQDGEIARLFAASPGTLYLLRPDLHIAGRWKAIVPGEILKTAGLCLGSETP